MAFQSVRGKALLQCACIAAGFISVSATDSVRAATPLDFPSPYDFSQGRVYAWRWGSFHLMDQPTQGPFEFTYAVGPSFFANEGEAFPPGAAEQIVVDALQSWTVASRGYFTFTQSPWPAVMNIGPTPPDQWEGPSVEDWLSGAYPDTYPGWGANFEFFSVPTGFQISSQGVNYKMKATSLAFTVVNRIGSTHIVSVDIYFNEDFNWIDAHGEPGDGDGGGGGQLEANTYDLSTVLLHELGHALGLDHPNQATGNGSWNINPYTFMPGAPWSPEDLMYAYYQGVRSHPTIDEVGGMAFLYNLPSPLDLVNDQTINGADIAFLLSNWGEQGIGLVGDINYDGIIGSVDLSLILANFGALIAPDFQPVVDETGPTPCDANPLSMLPLIRDCYHIPLNEEEGMPN